MRREFEIFCESVTFLLLTALSDISGFIFRPSSELVRSSGERIGSDLFRMMSDSQKRVEVYSSPGCKYCRIAKAELVKNRVSYVDIDLSRYESEVAWSEQERARRQHALSSTVPQIYVGSEYIGGCSELLAEMENDIFWERLKRNGVSITNGVVPKQAEINDPTMPLRRLYRPGEPLNAFHVETTTSSSIPPLSALQLSSKLQLSALRLIDAFASSDGRQLDYRRMAQSALFDEFVALTTQLQHCHVQELAAFTRDEKIAFWGNLYNALIVHAQCVLPWYAGTSELPPPPPQSAEAAALRSALFSGASGAVYRVGGGGNGGSGGGGDGGGDGSVTPDVRGHEEAALVVTPDIIEHAILRANFPHPSQVDRAIAAAAATATLSGGAANAKSDIELRDELYHTLRFLPDDHAMIRHQLPLRREDFDPRIHFVLNCGARSCPPIKVLHAGTEKEGLYDPRAVRNMGNIEQALSTAAAAYLRAELNVDEDARTVWLPRLLLWYGGDFGNTLEDVVAKVVQLLPEGYEVKDKLHALLATAKLTLDEGEVATAGTIPIYVVRYSVYDWSVNSV